MCVPKDSKRLRAKRGTATASLPDEFYKDLWSEVATIDAEESRLRGEVLREIRLDQDGKFHLVGCNVLNGLSGCTCGSS